MNEILCGIRVLKFYAWEDHFMEQVNQLRSKELCSLKGMKYVDAICVYFWATTPVIISILTFTTYSLLGHQLTAAKVHLHRNVFQPDVCACLSRHMIRCTCVGAIKCCIVLHV